MKEIEKEITREMKWVGITLIILIFVFLFTILVVANSILSDIEILKFINK